MSTGWAMPAPAKTPDPVRIFMPWPKGFASITPLQIDLTRHAALPELQKWLKLE